MENRNVSAEALELERSTPTPAPRPPAEILDLGPVHARPGPFVALVTDEKGFAALEHEWRELFWRAEAPTYFASFDWNWPCWCCLAAPDGARLAIVTVRRQGRLVAVLPLVVTRTGPFRIAVLLGAGTGRYGEALVDPVEDPAAIAAELRKGLALTRADAVLCDNVPAGSVLERCLDAGPRQAGGRMQAVEVRIGEVADFADYVRSLGSSLRKSLRRRRRRLEEAIGDISYELIGDPAQIVPVVGRLLDLKRGWLAARGLHGRFLEHRHVAEWMCEVSRRAESCGNLHLSVLRVGGRIAAGQLAFLAGRRLYCYLAAYDADLARFGVSKLHLEDILAEIAGTGVDLDLLPPADDYKSEFGAPGALVATHMVALTPAGRVALVLFGPRMRERAKAAYLALPKAVRAATARILLAFLGRVSAGRPAPIDTAEDHP